MTPQEFFNNNSTKLLISYFFINEDEIIKHLEDVKVYRLDDVDELKLHQEISNPELEENQIIFNDGETCYTMDDVALWLNDYTSLEDFFKWHYVLFLGKQLDTVKMM